MDPISEFTEAIGSFGANLVEARRLREGTADEKTSSKPDSRSRMSRRTFLKSVSVGTFLGGIGWAGMAYKNYSPQSASSSTIQENQITHQDAGVFVEKAPLTVPLESIQTQTDKVMGTVPMNLKEEAKASIPLVLQALIDEGINTKEVRAFTLSTFEYEANFDLTAKEFMGEEQAEELHYRGGKKYYGRGASMLTHEDKYDKYTKYLRSKYPKFAKVDLVNNPDQAREEDVSAYIIAAFMKNEGIADLVMQGRLAEARRKYVGDYPPEDTYNVQITKYIVMRTNSYIAAINK